MKITMTERIVKLETKIEDIKDALHNHCVDQREDFTKVLDKLDSFEKRLDTRFAGKWVEKVSIGVLVSFLSALVLLLLNLVGKL